MTAVRWQPRVRGSVLGAAAGILALSCLVASPAAGSPDRPVPVELAATPTTVEVSPQPCDRRGQLAVSMTNNGSSAAFVDARFSAPRAFQLSRQVWSTYLPATDPDQSVTAPLTITATRDTPPGEYHVTMQAEGRELPIPVTVTEPPGNGPEDNLALHRQAFASSTHHNVSLCGGVDGNADSTDWGDSGTHDATAGEFPDHYGVILDRALPVGRVEVHTLDSEQYPASEMGIRDFDVEVRVDGQWRAVASVRSNETGQVSLRFPPVTGDRVRVVVLDSNDHKYSRLVELEVYQQ